MKRLTSSSDSLLSFFSISSSSPKDIEMGFAEEIQAMLDGLDENDDVLELHQLATGTKKRRLSSSQVKALEKNFEEDNKLEPARKAKLAVELGLQPRQVAVWFQNRRARWKNKQLEKEYEVLKSSYEELKMSYENVGQEKEALNTELRDLKLKLAGETQFSESENYNIVSDQRISSSGESESNNLTNFIIHEPVNDYSHRHQTWSSSSSSLLQFDSSASWCQNGEQQIGSVEGFCSVYGAVGASSAPADPPYWLNFEQLDYQRFGNA
ncbi:hypothetical protein QQ045_000462 [Rhodiola kirilowii]